MARFHPLYVRRSDGKTGVVAKGKRKELNQPSDDQLDQRPDKDGISDFYRLVAMDEPKHLDWRRKLGGMLARELQSKDKSGTDNGFILVAFPENYRLYEHVKRTEKDGKLEVKSKTHAAGGNDRQDAYLYGHPAGKRKRFRSPNDFFPHLLWLATDESGDPDNCSCKICSPEELENLLPTVRTKQEKQEKFVKQEITAPPIARQPSQQGTSIKQDAPGAVPRPTPAQPKQLMPTPLHPPKNIDQKTDRRYNAFMYRTGELAWFKRGQAWGLGLITRRWTASGGPNTRDLHCYQVQPLSHPFSYPPSVTITAHSDMRPWLAWSLPRFTMPGLNDLPNPPRFETADWQGMMQRRYGNGDMEVDGSILASKAVDSTYTLFEKVRSVQPEVGIIQTSYHGIYLGAEKIWTGEPIRLAVGSGTDIMVVQDIVESKQIAPGSNQVVKEVIRLVGDVYRLVKVKHDNPQIPTLASPNNNPQLPPRLTEDLMYRNAQSIAKQGIASYWQLTGTNQRVDIEHVKGRWYEASLLLPVVDAARFDEANKKGEFQESSLWMNSRYDCLHSNRAPHLPKLARESVRKDTRKNAFGRSIASDVEIREGLMPPLPANVDPSLEAAAASSGAENTNNNNSNSNSNAMEIDARFDTAEDATENDAKATSHADTFDDLMNLDGMEEDDNASSQIPGFGQEYGSQGQNLRYF